MSDARVSFAARASYSPRSGLSQDSRRSRSSSRSQSPRRSPRGSRRGPGQRGNRDKGAKSAHRKKPDQKYNKESLTYSFVTKPPLWLKLTWDEDLTKLEKCLIKEKELARTIEKLNKDKSNGKIPASCKISNTCSFPRTEIGTKATEIHKTLTLELESKLQSNIIAAKTAEHQELVRTIEKLSIPHFLECAKNTFEAENLGSLSQTTLGTFQDFIGEEILTMRLRAKHAKAKEDKATALKIARAEEAKKKVSELTTDEVVAIAVDAALAKTLHSERQRNHRGRHYNSNSNKRSESSRKPSPRSRSPSSNSSTSHKGPRRRSPSPFRSGKGQRPRRDSPHPVRDTGRGRGRRT